MYKRQVFHHELFGLAASDGRNLLPIAQEGTQHAVHHAGGPCRAERFRQADALIHSRVVVHAVHVKQLAKAELQSCPHRLIEPFGRTGAVFAQNVVEREHPLERGIEKRRSKGRVTWGKPVFGNQRLDHKV